MFYVDDDRPARRTLGIRDKQILYNNAGGKCENPTCRKKIGFDEMQVGHKTAWSKGGSTTLKKSVCLCYRCNKLQGTDSWTTFLKKQNVAVRNPKAEMKPLLQALTIPQLKTLAKNQRITVKGEVVESLFESYTKAPTKAQYIKKLSGVVKEEELRSLPKPTTATPRKRKPKKSDDSWW